MEKKVKNNEIGNQLLNLADELKTLAGAIETRLDAQQTQTLTEQINSLAVYLGLGQHQEDDQLLNSVLNCAMHTVKAGGAGLTIYDHNKQRLVFRAAVGEGAEGTVGYEVPLEGSQHGLAFATGEIQASSPLHKAIEEKSGTVFQNVMVAPLIAGDETIGTISVVNKRNGQSFTRKDIDACQHFSVLAAQLLSKQLKEEIVRKVISGQPAHVGKNVLQDVFDEDQQLLIKVLVNIMSVGRKRPDLLESCLYFSESLLGKKHTSRSNQ